VLTVRVRLSGEEKILADRGFLAAQSRFALYVVYFSGQHEAASDSTQIGSSMFKFVFSAAFFAVLCLPTTIFAQCGCGCPKPARKRIALEQTEIEVNRLERKCVTNDCGCQSMKFGTVKKTVKRPQLTLVDRDSSPCGRAGLLGGLRDRMSNLGSAIGGGGSGCGCAAPAPAAPAPCGCDAAPAAASFDAAPVMDAAPIFSPVSAPVAEAASCCGG